MISVPASRNIFPTISSVYFFSAKITSVTREKRLYHGSSSHLLLGRPRVIRASRNTNPGTSSSSHRYPGCVKTPKSVQHRERAALQHPWKSGASTPVEERRFSA